MNYSLLKAQREFLEIPHDYPLDVALYQGGYGSGKTWAGSLLGILLCRKYPGIRGLVGAQTFPLVRDTTLVNYFEHLENLGYRRGKQYDYAKTEAKLVFSNGSEILFRYFDDSSKLKSLNLGFVEVEEMSDIPESTFKMLLGRLRQPIQQEWVDFVGRVGQDPEGRRVKTNHMTYHPCSLPSVHPCPLPPLPPLPFKYRLFGHTNPEPTKGWIYKTFVENPKPNYRLIIAPSTQNIFLPEGYVEELKKAYDPEYYRINVLGEFGNYSSGLVIKDFGGNNVREITYQPDLALHISCDFNVDPMAWILAHKTDRKVFFFDEIVLENTTTVKAVEEFYSRYPVHNAGIIINGDASGDNRSVNSEFTNYVLMKNRLSELGYKNIEIKIRDFNPPIKNRIAAWNKKIKDASGEICLFISPKCKWLIYNCENLKYREGTSQIDIPSHYQIKNNREMKFLGHPFDAASYLVEFYWPIILE